MGKESYKINNYFGESFFAEMQMIMDSVSDRGIIVTDTEGRIVMYNMAASFYDRVDQQMAIGTNYRDIYRDEDGGAIQRVLSEGQPIVNQLAQYHYADGTVMTSIDSVYPVYIEGKITYVITFTRYNADAQESMKKAFSKHFQAGGNSQHVKKEGLRYAFQDILGESDVMREAVKKAMRASENAAPVFLEGETGTGKEMFAQSIHNGGSRARSPFVAVNCAAIPENLLESTLFGTTKGSFTGAENKAGLFEQAKDGTFFLDEINSMPMFLQAKLLRVIQERRVRRVGASQETEIRCRIIASCNKKAEECIEEGSLRNDLYYRLSVIKIEIPPLRNRKSDIRGYIDAFLEKFILFYNSDVKNCTPEFYEALFAYDWPGNVRELEHVIESAVVMLNNGDVLGVSDLPANVITAYQSAKQSLENRIKENAEKTEATDDRQIDEKDDSCGENDAAVRQAAGSSDDSSIKSNDYIKNSLQQKEREMLIELLEKNNWNITRTASELHIGRSNLQYRIRRLEIKKPD